MLVSLLQQQHVSAHSTVAWGNGILVSATAIWTPTLCTFHSMSVIQEARVQTYTTLPWLVACLPPLYHCVLTVSLTVPLTLLSFQWPKKKTSQNLLTANRPPPLSTPHWLPPSAPHHLTFGTAALTQSRCQATLESGGEAHSWGKLTIKTHGLVLLIYILCPFTVLSPSQSDLRESRVERPPKLIWMNHKLLNAFYFNQPLQTCSRVLKHSDVKLIYKFSPYCIPASKVCLARAYLPRFFYQEVNTGIKQLVATKMGKRKVCFQLVWWAETSDSKQQHPHEIQQTSEATAYLI